MLTKYRPICEAIIRKANEDNLDFRDLMREWIHLFESTRVVRFSRDEFLDCLIECKNEKQEEDLLLNSGILCSECKEVFPEEDLDIINGKWICRICEERLLKDY